MIYYFQFDQMEEWCSVDDLKVITATNITALRTQTGMTQLELAEQLNYSDKSVSKWERAEAIPDAYVLKQMSEIFGVSVDYLLSAHDGTPPAPEEKPAVSNRVITTIAIVGIWTAALLAFIVCWLTGHLVWLIFAYAVPVSLITLLVLHSVWEAGRYNYWIIAALILSLIAVVYLTLWEHNWWQLFLLAIPAEIVVFLSSRIRKSRK